MKSITVPRHKNPAKFDPGAKDKSFLAGTQKLNQRRSTRLKWSHFQHLTQQPNQFYLTLQSSHVPYPHWIHVNLNHPQKVQVSLHANTKNKWFSTRVQKPRQFRQPTQPPSQFHPCTDIKEYSIPRTQIKSVWTTPTKTKSIFMLILKTTDFRPAYKWQVNFCYPHDDKKKFIPTLKLIRVRSPTLK